MTRQGERATPRRRRTRRKVFHEAPGPARLAYGGEDVIVLVSSFAATEPLVSGWTRVVGRLLAQGILEWSQAIPKLVREQAYRQRVSRASPPFPAPRLPDIFSRPLCKSGIWLRSRADELDLVEALQDGEYRAVELRRTAERLRAVQVACARVVALRRHVRRRQLQGVNRQKVLVENRFWRHELRIAAIARAVDRRRVRLILAGSRTAKWLQSALGVQSALEVVADHTWDQARASRWGSLVLNKLRLQNYQDEQDNLEEIELAQRRGRAYYRDHWHGPLLPPFDNGAPLGTDPWVRYRYCYLGPRKGFLWAPPFNHPTALAFRSYSVLLRSPIDRTVAASEHYQNLATRLSKTSLVEALANWRLGSSAFRLTGPFGGLHVTTTRERATRRFRRTKSSVNGRSTSGTCLL